METAGAEAEEAGAGTAVVDIFSFLFFKLFIVYWFS